MYLKRLELHGFKSFATYTEMEFVPGISAIVGPNGSGKSNVSDAVRWVLGEQSARSLRGGKMEDVIFAGSDSRSAINYCEVTLTLDNSERDLPLAYSEVTITRRLYRSGESEYYLNGQLCRLKDVTELFMDTGLGKEAYSLIGQGRIDAIIGSKAEERRAVFEDAAAIVKFKVRKREAERKLDKTEQNLSRLSDLIAELRERAGPLAEQAEQAKRYRRLRERLKRLEIGLYVHHIARIHRDWEQSAAHLQALEQKRLEAKTALRQQEATMENHKWQLQELDDQLQSVQKELLATSEAAEKAGGQHDVLLERERNLRAEKERFAEQARQLQKRLVHVENDLRQVEKQLQAKEAEVAETKRELGRREEILTRMGKRAEEALEDAKARLDEHRKEITTLKNELRFLDEKARVNREQQQRVTKEIERVTSLAREIDAKRLALKQEHSLLNARLTKSTDDYKAALDERDAALAREQELTERRRDIERRLHTLRSRREVLQEWTSDFSGFYQGVKRILQAREHGKAAGIEGAVAELVQVPRELELAVETALGPALQHIIVKSERHARAAIAYLKKHRFGRATFLPMDVIKERNVPPGDRDKVARDKGFVGIAAELVTCDPSHRHIVASLLGRVIIARTMKDANRIARATGYRCRVVTLEGDVVNPGGSMSGGSVQKRSANLLGRKRELTDLESHIQKTSDEAEALSLTIDAHVQEKKRIEARLEQLRESIEQMRLQEQRLNSQSDHLLAAQQDAAKTLDQLGHDDTRLSQETDAIGKKRTEMQTRLAAYEKAANQLREEIDHLEQVTAAQKKEQETETTAVTELKVHLAKLQQEHAHLIDSRRRLIQERSSLKDEERVLTEQIGRLTERMKANAAEKEQISYKMRQWRHAQTDVNERLEVIRNDRREAQLQLDALEAEHRKQRKALQTVDEELRKQEVKVERLDVKLDNLLASLSEQYEISYERARDRYEVPSDVHAAEQEVAQLKARIKALGEVNTGAIEEYTRVSERLAFLEGQQQDLLEAKATLYDVIGNMDREMSARFLSTFEAIREQFQRIFVELFGGGRADLLLTDPDSVLDTGIDIIAQPPGKKLRHLSLLSGGERTLTAIVLLFAILRVRPVPFCILDEVDAALDEANIVRFARYLRQFGSETQFIVITHRKGTMEEADVLYGVTMQESGVSKLVSVKLADGAEQEAAFASELNPGT